MHHFDRVRSPWLPRLFLGVLLAVSRAGSAEAQGSDATIEVRLDPTGDAVAIPVQLQSSTDPARSWSAQLAGGESVRFRLVPPGNYRLTSGTAVQSLDVASGDKLVVQVSGAAPPAPEVRQMLVRGTHRTAYGTRFDQVALDLLPRSGSVYGLIERSDPLVVTEHIEGGGAHADPQRLASSGASWTQTSFRLGDADVTDPDRTGFAMIYPNLDTLQAVSVTTAGLPPDGYGGGTSVMLVPRTPASTWQRTIQFDVSPAAFQSVNPLPAAPSIARLLSGTGASFVVTGPVSERVGLLVAGELVRSTRIERGQEEKTMDSRARTLTAHLAYKATPRDDVRLFAQSDGLSFPAEGRAGLVDPSLDQKSRSTLLSTTWDRTARVGFTWSANVTYAVATSDGALSGVPVLTTMERLRDGPVGELAASTSGKSHRTAFSWRGDPGPLTWLGRRQLPQFGASLVWTGVRRDAPGSSLIGELVDGEPARAWQYSTDGQPSRAGGRELALWAADEMPLTEKLDLNLGLRGTTTASSRNGESAGIGWRALSPSATTTWRPFPDDRLTLVIGLASYSARLPLNYLSFGDPHALAGTVHLWNDLNHDRTLQANEVGSQIASVGPCCANGRLNTIAADLHAPRTTEIRASLQARLTDHLVLRLGGTDRRTSALIQPVNTIDMSNFSLTHVEDTGLNLLDPADDQVLPVFNRLPSSAHADAYVLQNIDSNPARDHGLDLVLERAFRGRWGMLVGATAHKSTGAGGNRGFLPNENDQGVLGEVFSDPNAATSRRGRLFSERGYVVKWSMMFQLPYGMRAGTAARYQDGQHFARVVIAPGLDQGVDFIPALPRGLTRFTYTFTLDGRLEKQIRMGAGHASLILQVFNLLNTNNEVEEYTVTGPDFRAPTAVQPPRSLRLGLRFTF